MLHIHDCQPITIYAMLNSGTRDSVFILNLTILFQALLLASHVHQMLTAQLRPVTKVKSLSVTAVHVTVTMWTNATTPTTAHAQTMKQLHVIITIAIVPRHKLKSKFINPIINLKSCFISLSLSLSPYGTPKHCPFLDICHVTTQYICIHVLLTKNWSKLHV